MATTYEIEAGRPIDLGTEVVGLGGADRRARIVDKAGRGTQRIDAITGKVEMVYEGEQQGMEVVARNLVSGAVSVRLELPEGHRAVEMGAGDALVVPQGVWHRITLRDPGRLVHVTPGPGGAARPLGSAR